MTYFYQSMNSIKLHQLLRIQSKSLNCSTVNLFHRTPVFSWTLFTQLYMTAYLFNSDKRRRNNNNNNKFANNINNRTNNTDSIDHNTKWVIGSLFRLAMSTVMRAQTQGIHVRLKRFVSSFNRFSSRHWPWTSATSLHLFFRALYDRLLIGLAECMHTTPCSQQLQWSLFYNCWSWCVKQFVIAATSTAGFF